MRMLLMMAGLTTGFSMPAAAHYLWKNGQPVPSWVKTLCCGKADAHMLEPSDVWQDEHGAYHIKGNEGIVLPKQVLPSQDGRYWAFYASYPDGTQSTIYCLFVPFSM